MAENRYIVRIAGRDLNGNKPIYHALAEIKGIGTRMARILAYEFERVHHVSHLTKIGELPEDMDAHLEQIVLNPLLHQVPLWAVNRRQAIAGKDGHLVMNDLDFAIRNDLQTMKKLHSYKGVRHSLGLTVRGQRTKTSGRKRGASVGVDKKKEAPATKGEKK
ncbi:MAG: 30S ribosomal protein S13 [Candidatus Diapherotrites archaeon]|nr:30S ribosomal protein S13 [Candidatus Diapherotrites archaeon]MDZ4256024.1 30S ribosomal protein S13 [archaeon]